MWPPFVRKVISEDIETCFHADAGMAPLAVYCLQNTLLSPKAERCGLATDIILLWAQLLSAVPTAVTLVVGHVEKQFQTLFLSWRDGTHGGVSPVEHGFICADRQMTPTSAIEATTKKLRNYPL